MANQQLQFRSDVIINRIILDDAELYSDTVNTLLDHQVPQDPHQTPSRADRIRSIGGEDEGDEKKFGGVSLLRGQRSRVRAELSHLYSPNVISSSFMGWISGSP